jgi:hypothetical protein
MNTRIKFEQKGEATLIVIAIVAVVCLFGGFVAHKKLAGNSTISKPDTTQQQAVTAVQSNIVAQDTKLLNLNIHKLQDIAVIATGTDYSLDKVTNPPPAVTVAKELNQRVIAEAGYNPSIEELKKMQKMVDDLIVSNKLGQIALAQKDKDIEQLRQEEELILKEKGNQIGKLSAIAKKTAEMADNTKSELNKYTQWFGLGAVYYGLKTFLTTSFWVLIGIGIVWIVLRLLSTVNPIFGAIYGIVDTIGSMIIHIISVITPKALSMAQSVETSTVHKLVDTIQYVKDSNGDIEKLKSELNTALSDKEKNLITEIKKKYNW